MVGFRDVHPFCWFGFPEGVVSESIDHSSSGCWCFYYQLIHSRRVFPSIDLSDSPDTDEPVRVTFQHELLKRAHLFQVALLCSPKDSLSQVTNSPIGFPPVNSVPVGLLLGSVCKACCLHLTFPLINSLHIVLWVMHQDHVSRLSTWVSPVARPYLLSYGFLLPFD